MIIFTLLILIREFLMLLRYPSVLTLKTRSFWFPESSRECSFSDPGRFLWFYVNITLVFGCVFCFMERSPDVYYVETFRDPLENIPVRLYERSPNINVERTFSKSLL